MFFAGAVILPLQSFFSALILLGVILLGVFMTLLVSKFLSKTFLKGVPSSFALELPPYRRPQIGKVIIRSILDRTLFVLGRAVVVAVPAGLIIWLLANITIGDISVLKHCTDFLDPFAHWFGMDGVILMAFILGFPANEIVIPIIIMSYMATGSLADMQSLEPVSYPFAPKWLDNCYGNLRYAVLYVPFSLFDHLHHYFQRDKELKMDRAGLFAADPDRTSFMLYCCQCRADIWPLIDDAHLLS